VSLSVYCIYALHYKVDDNNIAIANCETCKLVISRGGKKKATFNTTNLASQKQSRLTLQESLKRREKCPLIVQMHRTLQPR